MALASIDCVAAWDALRWRTLPFVEGGGAATEAPNDFARLGGGHQRSCSDGRRAGRVVTWRTKGSSLWLAELDITGE